MPVRGAGPKGQRASQQIPGARPLSARVAVKPIAGTKYALDAAIEIQDAPLATATS